MSLASTFRASLESVSKTTCTSLRTERNCSLRRVRRWKIRSEQREFPNELGFGHRGASRKTQHVGVPYIAEVFDPNLAGEKSVGGHLSQERKELHALTYLRILIGVLAERDQVENFFLLL